MRGLVLIHRADGYTFMHGYEPRSAMRAQGLPTGAREREFRGIVLRQNEGLMIIVAHQGSISCSFNFLARETGFQKNLWEGYVARAQREKVNGIRAARMIYEHLGTDTGTILRAARGTGLVEVEDIPPFSARLLRLDQPFR